MHRRHAIGMTVFCLISGSRWLVDTAFPSTLPPLEAESLHFLVLAFAGGVWMLVRRQAPQMPRLPLLAGGLLLFAVPSLLNEWAHSVASEVGAALFTLTPLCVIVGAAAWPPHDAPSPNARTLMAPALVGIAGGLLLLPFQIPSTPPDFLLFAVVLVAVVITAAASLWLHSLLRERGLAAALAVIGAGNALLLGTAAICVEPASPPLHAWSLEVARGLILDLPQLVLLLWLLREIAPVRLGARFLVVPLATAVEGIALLHPRLDTRMVLGLLLMTAGSSVLLLSHVAEEDAMPTLRLGG